MRFTAARTDNVFVRGLITPGLMLQRLTTREPDESMIECAIAALKPVLAADGIVIEAAPDGTACHGRRHRLRPSGGHPTPMPTRTRVAVLRTQPETVLQDYARLYRLAGVMQALDPSATTILKDKHILAFPMPAANTTPWQLEGSILALPRPRVSPIWCACRIRRWSPMRSRVRPERLCTYLPPLRDPGTLQLQAGGHGMDSLPARVPNVGPGQYLSRGDSHPGLLHRQEHRPPAHGEDHMYTTTTGAMKNASEGC